MNAPEATYSPRLRTGVVLCGAGTAGAYHAGALRALTEAGVKMDVVAAHGSGVGPALLFAVDGDQRLWDPAGLWADPRLGRSYHWRTALKVAALWLTLAAVILAAPSLVFVLGAVVYAAGVAAALVGLPTRGQGARVVVRGSHGGALRPAASSHRASAAPRPCRARRAWRARVGRRARRPSGSVAASMARRVLVAARRVSRGRFGTWTGDGGEPVVGGPRRVARAKAIGGRAGPPLCRLAGRQLWPARLS